jgi:hypothetical protein
LRFIHHPATALSLNDCSCLAKAKGKKSVVRDGRERRHGRPETLWSCCFVAETSPPFSHQPIGPGVVNSALIRISDPNASALPEKARFAPYQIGIGY